MELALRSFQQTHKENSLPILGDMFELGTHSAIEHQNMVDLLEELGFKNAVLVGKHFSNTKSTFQQFQDVEGFIEWLKEHPLKEKHLFIKGSRSMQLETILEYL